MIWSDVRKPDRGRRLSPKPPPRDPHDEVHWTAELLGKMAVMAILIGACYAVGAAILYGLRLLGIDVL